MVKSFLMRGSDERASRSLAAATLNAFTSAFVICLVALSSAHAQTPPPPQPTPAASTPAPRAGHISPRRPGPQTKSPVAPGAYAIPPRAQSPTPAAAPQPPAAPPRNVVTVLHRIDGMKLLALLATRGEEALVIDELPTIKGVHMNIVAGFVSSDGRTVVARLPRAEAEVQDFTPPPQPASLFNVQPMLAPREPEFMLISGDGRAVEAKFVGLDATTGLSLLEAAEPLLAPAPTPRVEPPAVGQRVRLYAPARTSAPTASTPPAPIRAPTDVDSAEGVIYFSIGETEGHLTEVRRAPSGGALQATVHASRITPEWTGAIATSETGDFVGIVGDSGHTESQIVPAEMITHATERVLARRASVPQPWLGVKGDAVRHFSIEQVIAKGWPREFARPLLSSGQGVLLTGVAPGAPAAVAGLKPGDIISRIGEREVRGVEEFSQMLRDAGAGAKLDLTVLRAFEIAPLKMTVELSGTKDPWREMQERFQNPLAVYGVQTVRLSERSAAGFGAQSRLLIVAVQEGGPAASVGLRPGDVIETLNGQQPTRLHWRKLSESAMKELTLVVVREGKRLTFKLQRTEKPERD